MIVHFDTCGSQVSPVIVHFDTCGSLVGPVIVHFDTYGSQVSHMRVTCGSRDSAF